MRKLSILLAVAVVASVLLIAPAIALANFAIHGGYAIDTDACAGCHRAHTAASPITWSYTDPDTGETGAGSALLISTATELYEFCFTCHGTAAAGAATNVWDGIYESDAHGDFLAPLNSGAFSDDVVGINKHTYNGSSWGAWGGGDTGRVGIISQGHGGPIPMSCGSCHDVHGSSNYRLLKDIVNGVQVGGYAGPGDPGYDPEDPEPMPFVISNEEGYPEEGWRLLDAGHAQMEDYVPNFTTPLYAKAPEDDPAKGISAWCAACHTQYHLVDDVTGDLVFSSVYDANDSFDNNVWGLTMRYRHPINVELDNYFGPRPLVYDTSVNTLPVARSYDPANIDITVIEGDEWIDCLTCHRAHGSDATMEGFATDQAEGWETDWGTVGPQISYPGTKNAFLRGDNREVCQRCHRK